MSEFPFNYQDLPPACVDGLILYVAFGEPGGDFTTAVLEGDLHEACRRADSKNQRLIPTYAALMYNYFPAGTFGTADKVSAYQRAGGLLEQTGVPITIQVIERLVRATGGGQTELDYYTRLIGQVEEQRATEPPEVTS